MSTKYSLRIITNLLRWNSVETTTRTIFFLTRKCSYLSCRTDYVFNPFYGNQSVRNYAKVRDGKKGKSKTHIYEHELNEFFDVEKLREDFNRPLEIYKNELIHKATLRSSKGAIENFKFKFEGSTYIIQDLAEIGKKNPKFYILDFSSFPQVIPTVLEELQKSSLNLNPQQEGTKLFIHIPKVTKDQREELAKKIKVLLLKCKDSIRSIENQYKKNLNKVQNVSEEAIQRISAQLKAMGDAQINIAENLLKEKQSQLLNED